MNARNIVLLLLFFISFNFSYSQSKIYNSNGAFSSNIIGYYDNGKIYSSGGVFSSYLIGFIDNGKIYTKGGVFSSNIAGFIENGKIYYLLYYYFGLIDFKLIQGNDIETIPTKLLYNRIEDLMTGKNKMLDYICNSILNHEPIFAENKWPPISV